MQLVVPPNRCIYQVSYRCINHIEKKTENVLKNPKRTKIIVISPKIRILQKKNLCREVYRGLLMYQICKIYLDLWGYNCKKWVWPIFTCKVGQRDPVVMKLNLGIIRPIFKRAYKIENKICFAEPPELLIYCLVTIHWLFSEYSFCIIPWSFNTERIHP